MKVESKSLIYLGPCPFIRALPRAKPGPPLPRPCGGYRHDDHPYIPARTSATGTRFLWASVSCRLWAYRIMTCPLWRSCTQHSPPRGCSILLRRPPKGARFVHVAVCG
ncbi:hypothetical protein K523DRAFT_137121 [Schizophyllum commune Tattone D]|nr:hypothetical protein K523DRAFT_137121 [Schizophyllum commune Tattone D]